MKKNKLKSIIIKTLIGLVILIVLLFGYIQLNVNNCFNSCPVYDIVPYCPEGMTFDYESYRPHWYCLLGCDKPTCVNNTDLIT